MKFSEICEKIKSGEFSIDYCNHSIYDIKESLLEYYQHTLDDANGANDGKWDSDKRNPEKDWDKDMRDLYLIKLNWDYKKENQDSNFILDGDHYCSACGERVRLSFNGNGLSADVYLNKNLGKFGKFERGPNCAYSNSPALTVEIDITDKLIFANWFPDFQEDAPEGKKYTREYELNSICGMTNIAKWKAKNQNVAYTQVGSCGSTSIWMNKEKDHGYICTGHIDENDDYYDEEKKKYILPEFLKGYRKVGKTDVTVWRIEMADTAKVDVKQVEEKWKVSGPYADAAIVKVKKGKWSLTSHYSVEHPLSNQILAEIKLVK